MSKNVTKRRAIPLWLGWLFIFAWFLFIAIGSRSQAARILFDDIAVEDNNWLIASILLTPIVITSLYLTYRADTWRILGDKSTSQSPVWIRLGMSILSTLVIAAGFWYLFIYQAFAI